MKHCKRICSALVIVVALIFMASVVYADSETLRGLKGINVLVEGLGPETESTGLTEQQIQTDVELKFRMAGIKVLTGEERFTELGSPYLYVNLTAMKLRSRSYTYSIYISLNQEALIVRNNVKDYSATTWNRRGMGTANSSTTIRNHIKDLVDEFINAYLSVNPK